MGIGQASNSYVPIVCLIQDNLNVLLVVFPSGPPSDGTSPNAVVLGALESLPLVAGQRTVTWTWKWLRDEVTETIGPGPSTAKKIKSPDEPPDGPLKLTMGTLELKFPELFALAAYTKGYYRSQCLIKTPYLPKKEEKLILADKSDQPVLWLWCSITMPQAGMRLRCWWVYPI